MKKTLYFLIMIILFSCNSENKTNPKEVVIKKFIEYRNTTNKIGMDSILTEDFSYISDNIKGGKKNLLDGLTKPKNNKLFLVKEIKLDNNTAIVKEEVTDDITNYLGVNPTINTYEFHFNEKNIIKSIFLISQDIPKNYKSIQELFYKWAEIVEKYNNNQDIEDEKRFLLAKIKSEGIQVLDKYDTNKQISTDKKEIRNNSQKKISSTKFKKSVLGKTKNEIKKLYGKPCSTQTMTGLGNIWYYGRADCIKDPNRTIIYDEDSEKEISQAQILFSGNIATVVNFM